MTAWTLTKGLAKVKSEFNAVFPLRDHASDGAIGNATHAAGTSGHNPEESGHAEYNDHDSLNEVRAIDVDSDLRDASPRKVSFEIVIQYLVQKGRKGDYLPFRYFIYRSRIWRKATGWKTESYSGPSAHNEHGHFSGDYTQEADNWSGLLGLASLVKPIVVPPKPPAPGTTLPVHANGSRENSASKNNVGTDVATLQRFIGSGKCGPADGHFGAKTTAGVKWYQNDRGMKVDGIAGKNTWAPILRALK